MRFSRRFVIRRGLCCSKGLHLLVFMVVAMILLGSSCSRPEGPSLSMVEPEPVITAGPTVAPSPDAVQQATPQGSSDRTPEETPTEGFATAIEALDQITIFSSPSEGSSQLKVLSNPGPFSGPRILETTGQSDNGFIEVVIPVLPNKSIGWVMAEDVAVSSTDQLIVVDLSDREAALFVDGVVTLSAPVAIGTDETPTPVLEAIIDVVWDRKTSEENFGAFYGSHLFGLNQHSEVLQSFDGKRPAIAIHGTTQPELIGLKVSNGCIRMRNEDIAAFAEYVTLGTRVLIID